MSVKPSDKPWHFYVTHHVLMQWKIHHGAKKTLTTRRHTRQSRLLSVLNKVSEFKFCHFLRNSNNKFCFVALKCVVTDRCSTSVQAACDRSSLTSYSTEWTSEGILFQLWKYVNKHYFSSSSLPMLIYSPVWFVCQTKMADLALWLLRLPVNQTPGEGSIEQPRLGKV